MPTYRVQRDQQRYLANSFAELRQWVDDGRVGPDDFVWSEGWTDWVKAYNIEGLKDLFHRRNMRPSKRNMRPAKLPDVAQKSVAPSISSKEAKKKVSRRASTPRTQEPVTQQVKPPAVQKKGYVPRQPFLLELMFPKEEAHHALRLRRDDLIEYPYRYLKAKLSFERFRAAVAEGTFLMSAKHDLAGKVFPLLDGLSVDIFRLPEEPDVFIQPKNPWACEAYAWDGHAFLIFGGSFLRTIEPAHLLFVLARFLGQIQRGDLEVRSAAKLLNDPTLCHQLQLGAPPHFSTAHYLRWLKKCDLIDDRIAFSLLQDVGKALGALRFLQKHSEQSVNASVQELDVYFRSLAPAYEHRKRALEDYPRSTLYSPHKDHLARFRDLEATRNKLCRVVSRRR
ncbi:MAG TPA: hypothetical protein DCE42_29710 [Myxococcales bacterium]|mgnify:CR=1 FL=1|nr:hypothetical protein [Deltaproteobacteria bacterium]MBU49681.1 hypothetical protein [Deltaproteobacteria bacterium]HAA58968.1 hypothetical protein [Myxococcales bacterium]|tara:strand:+ start:1981 stop:3162 length:1182 start_codon:yes stop_codon:yes gene_type:complete